MRKTEVNPWRVRAATIPGARRETLAGAEHVPHQTHPDQLVGILRSFAGAR